MRSLERANCHWANHLRQGHAEIRDQMLATDDHDEPSYLLRLKFSNGWLHRFKTRFKLKSRRVYGEAASASERTVEDGRRSLLAVTSGYDKRDNYNLDETAYFYCSTPPKTVCTKGTNTTAFLQPQDAGIIQGKVGVLRATYLVEKYDKLVASADESNKENFGSLVNKLHEVSLVSLMKKCAN
ncbi:hypothetical protein H310_07398 [Aphanomyces invadans]|uniref:HTH CENPB-type domain-containing protein n=1 Tax=Aphanomyces invadans TaxID=157072 RepID=A0A024U3A1_9STRA|nr:hypothetical protein H310_07398 [Aphanomyces invadans]ETW00881.1 hypothetical protein H310_07398 [Aphanomyces invadans]|eukprot:XP_008871016.1 hypothetical protein H310_07398 [Aphanomyces invadans]